jgi:hypothetical protein
MLNWIYGNDRATGYLNNTPIVYITQTNNNTFVYVAELRDLQSNNLIQKEYYNYIFEYNDILASLREAAEKYSIELRRQKIDSVLNPSI